MSDPLTEKKRIQAKIMTPHSPHCYAVAHARDGRWGTPWAYLDEVVYRDSIGRRSKGSHHRWWRVRCNCSPCTGTAIVSERDILERMPHE